MEQTQKKHMLQDYKSVIKQAIKSNAVPYAFVLSICTLLCFGFERFILTQSEQNDTTVVKSIIGGFVATEYYMHANAKSATIALNYYLKSNGGDTYTPDYRNPDELKFLASELGVHNFSIYGADGKAKYTMSGSMVRDPKHFESYNLLHCDGRRQMMYERFASKSYPIRSGIRNTFSYQDLTGFSWFGERKQFILSVIHATELSGILKHTIINDENIKKIVLSSPSGSVLMDTCNVNNSCGSEVGNQRQYVKFKFEDYDESPVITNEGSYKTVSIPFGGLRDFCGTANEGSDSLAHDKVDIANAKGQYFYVMNVTFNKSSLNTQLWFLRIIFSFISLSLFFLIYYKQKLNQKTEEMAMQTEALSHKAIDICNVRLGEIRRYVTKIVKDNMRVRNMNQQIPTDVMKVFDQAFEKFTHNKPIEMDNEVFNDELGESDSN